MEMIVLLGLCIVTVAFMAKQNAAMQRLKRVRVERDERSGS